MTTKKKVILGIMIVCVLLLTAACLLSAPPEGIGNRLLSDTQKSEQKPVYAAGFSNKAAFQEEGIFYISGTRLCFYDCGQEREYVFCSDSGCRHTSETCSAYIGGKRLYGGYAMHQGRVYVMYADEDSPELQIVSMDPAGKDKKIIARLDIGNGDLDEWTLKRIGDVYYDHGYAYLHLHWMQAQENNSLDGEQLLAVRLSDGRVTELTDILIHEREYIAMSFELISGEDVIVSVWRYAPPVPSYEEYIAEHPNVEYEEYYQTVCENAPQETVYYNFCPEDETQEVWYEEERKLVENSFWGIRSYMSSLLFLGTAEEQWLLMKRPMETFGEGGSYFLWDPKTRETEIFQETSASSDGSMSTGYGEVVDIMYSDREILWMDTEEKDGKRRKKISLYDLYSGEKRELYTLDTDDPDFPDIRGFCGNDVILGKNEYGGVDVYVISREDFEKGNWDAAKRTPVSL